MIHEMHLIKIGISDMLVAFIGHMIKLFFEFLGLIGLNELFVHLYYFII